MTNIQKDIEAILGECVGEFPKVYGIDIVVSEDKNIDLDAYKVGYNQALADMRNRIPAAARKVLERMSKDVQTILTEKLLIKCECQDGDCPNCMRLYDAMEAIASLAGDEERRNLIENGAHDFANRFEGVMKDLAEDEGDNGKNNNNPVLLMSNPPQILNLKGDEKLVLKPNDTEHER